MILLSGVQGTPQLTGTAVLNLSTHNASTVRAWLGLRADLGEHSGGGGQCPIVPTSGSCLSPSRSSSVSSVALSTHASVLLLKHRHTPSKQEQNKRNDML